MSIARARAFQSLQSSLRHSGTRATPRLSASARTQLAIGRRYASGGGGHAAPSSDLPWLVGAIAVTIPSCWYLWPSTSHADSGHHGGHEEHAETHEEKEEGEEEAPQEEEKPAEEPEQQEEQPEPKQDEGEKQEEPAQDTTPQQEEDKESPETAKASGSEGEAQPAGPDANKQSSRTEGSEMKDTPDHTGDTSGAKFKGNMKDDSGGHMDTRKREPDSKGAYKKRIDSGLQTNLGESEEGDQAGEPREEAASAKAPKKESQGDISSKQMGMSNSPTRHSHMIDQDPEKSKKGEGTPETAKSMGTVSVNRPQK